jgi:transposase-like protein
VTKSQIGLMRVLVEIRDLLAMSVVAQEAETSDGECDHPEDQRVSLGIEAGAQRWVCKVCRFDSAHPNGLSQN